MTENPIAVSPDTDLAKVRNLMYERWIRHLPVLDPEEGLSGLISHRDLLKRSLIERDDVPPLVEEEILAGMQCRQVMQTLVESVSPETSIEEAGRTLLHHKYGCLPVLREGRLVGMLTESDFIRYVTEL